MTDPLPRLVCDCGWPRPLIGITRTDGLMPTEALRIFYDCPQCGRVYAAGDVTKDAPGSPRARAIAEESTRIPSRRIL